MVDKIYALKTVLDYCELHEDSKKKLLESLSNFKCKYNNVEVETFLSRNASDFEKRDLSRTYIVYDKNPFDIIAYFNVAIKSLTLSDVSNEMRKKISSNKDALTAPAFLLGQIGQTKDCYLKKYELLDTALYYLKTAQKIIAGRSVYLDCEKDNKKLFEYYYCKGFRYLSEDNKYIQMTMRL